MDEINQLLEKYYNNEMLGFLMVLTLSLAIAYIVGRALKLLLNQVADRVEKMKRPLLAATFNSVAQGVTFFTVAIALKVGSTFVAIDPKVANFISIILAIFLWAALTSIAYKLVDVVCEWLHSLGSKRKSKMDEMLVPVVGSTLRSVVVVLFIVQVAQLLSDQSVSSILAGLGIGGIAIGFAAKDTIANFFGSLVIFTDKPFELGDRVSIDGHEGFLEKVGIRSTRVRTLDGHLVTIPNGQLANKTIRNISNRPFIRRVFDIGITYDTPPEKVKRAVGIIREILENHEGMSEKFPPRAFFFGYGAYSLDIRVIYWFHPPMYWDYLAFSEKFNQTLLERFNEEGIEFAFPTQTLYMAKDPGRELEVSLAK